MYRHIRRLDLTNQGILEEVAVMKEDSNGDIYFIKIEHLDEIDLNRLSLILRKKEARLMPLWDLLSSIKLNNGMNALVYFHQFVTVRTAGGQLMKPNPRKRGVAKTMSLYEQEAQRVGPETQQSETGDAPHPVKKAGRQTKAQ